MAQPWSRYGKAKYGQDVTKIWYVPKFTLSMKIIWPRFDPDLVKIWPMYGKDMAKLEPRYGQDKAKNVQYIVKIWKI